MRRAVPALALLALAACAEKPAPSREPVLAPPSVAAAGASAYVTAVTLLRREPSDAARVPGAKGKDVVNQVATLQRGEKVTVVETDARVVGNDEWVHVRSSDDREGWLKRSVLLEGEGVFEATVLAPADVFDRPDLLAANVRRKIDPGTLLLVVRAKAPFSEVNVSNGPNAWVLSDRLATGAPEVSVAKLAEKARWLKKTGKADEAAQIVAFARSEFGGVGLVELLAAEIAGEAPPGGEVVPAAARGDSPGAQR